MELFDQGYNYQQIAKKVAYQIIAELAAFRWGRSKKESREISWGSEGNADQRAAEKGTDAFGGIEKRKKRGLRGRILKKKYGATVNRADWYI